jgi:hypothetical protein
MSAAAKHSRSDRALDHNGKRLSSTQNPDFETSQESEEFVNFGIGRRNGAADPQALAVRIDRPNLVDREQRRTGLTLLPA